MFLTYFKKLFIINIYYNKKLIAVFISVLSFIFEIQYL